VLRVYPLALRDKMATVYQIITDETGTRFDTGIEMYNEEVKDLVDTIMYHDANIMDFVVLDGTWTLLIDRDLGCTVLQIKW
jgi:hypothetical protein